MFEDLTKKLTDLKPISIPIEPDQKGYIDKQCPSEGCKFLFKVHAEDWANHFKDETVWCPMCRCEAPSTDWYTLAQIEHAKNQALNFLKGEIHNALVSGAEKFNRQQSKYNLVNITMSVRGGIVQTSIIPAMAEEVMQLEVSCESCCSRYAVIGNAFFCPACGHNSVTKNYSDALKKIQVKRDSLEIIRRAMIESTGKDEAATMCRSLLESCILDGIVAFQKLCEGLYVDFGTSPFNAFQRIDEGSELWRKAIGYSYVDWLGTEDLNALKVLYQKRHILAHNDGIVDVRYLLKSGDVSYTEGQRIVISNQDITNLLAYLDRLGNKLKSACRNVE